ncbi:MAG: hypothetical protein HYS39_03275 [Proteobacteria bacterium]|nr:hypothetical protein [Pseudomonadota bacterium]
MNTVTMRLFGSFKKYGRTVELTVLEGSSISTIKRVLAEKLGELVTDSVIANDETILSDDYVIKGDTYLSILPPVCGG